MRWKDKVLLVGDTRTIEKFLLFPRCIGYEWRWLEKAKILQRFERSYHDKGYWRDIGWANK